MEQAGTCAGVEELRGVPLFSGMPGAELRRLLEEGREKKVARGEVNERSDPCRI